MVNDVGKSGGILSAQARVNGLLTLLDVGPAGENRFRGRRKPGGEGRVYGGQVIAQALAAALKTVPEERPVHSLHAYFLRGGDEQQEIDYQVAADFDGGSFSNRRVIASQAEGVILNLAASFHRHEPGHTHQAPMPDVERPENLPTVAEYLAENPSYRNALTDRFLTQPGAMEIRSIGAPPMCVTDPMEPALSFWFRTVIPIDQPQWMHRSILAYATDFALLTTSMRPHGRFPFQVASLDHSIWFHRDVRADEWLLYYIESPWSGAGRGLSIGRIYNGAGELVASVAQEGVIRDINLRKG